MDKIKVSKRSHRFLFPRYIFFLRRLIGIRFWETCSIGTFDGAVDIGKAGNYSDFGIRSWSQIWFRPRTRVRSPLRGSPYTSFFHHNRTTTILFSGGILLGLISPEGTEYSDNGFFWGGSHCSVKNIQNFLGLVDFRASLAKHVKSFAFVAQHHRFLKESIPCDPSWKVIFLGSITESHRVEDSNMPFFVLNISVEFVCSFKQISLPNHLRPQRGTISHK